MNKETNPQKKKILGIIPARGGSKRIPKKNIKSLGDVPLIAWTIVSAKASKYIDRLILTSDDNEIMRAAKSFGCEVPFTRPSALSLDTTPGISPVLHALTEIKGYDYVVLLQPTSPFRTAKDIDDAASICLENNWPCVVSVCEVEHSPYWMYQISEFGLLKPLLEEGEKILRSQDAPKVYRANGAIYIASVPWLLENQSFFTKETRAFEMPQERSLDIDSPMDFQIAEHLVASKLFSLNSYFHSVSDEK